MQRILLMFFMSCLFLSGCAANGIDSQAQESEHRKALMRALTECIGESSIDAALWSDDLDYIVGSTRKMCANAKDRLFNAYPPSFRLEYDDEFNAVYNQDLKKMAVFAMDHLKDKKRYFDRFFDCTGDNILKRIKRENPTVAEELAFIGTDETAMCYDNILGPYISAGKNKYTIIRKSMIVEKTSKIYMNIVLEQLREPETRKTNLQQKMERR